VSAALRDMIRESERDSLAVAAKLGEIVAHARAEAELFSNIMASLASEEAAVPEWSVHGWAATPPPSPR